MRDFVFSPEARLDLIHIQDFIAQDNPFAAATVIDEIFDAFELLADHPMAGHKREDLTIRDVRFWNVHSYLIIYDPHTSPIGIVRVLSGYRDIMHILD